MARLDRRDRLRTPLLRQSIRRRTSARRRRSWIASRCRSKHVKMLNVVEFASRECVDVSSRPAAVHRLRRGSRTSTACRSSASTTCRARQTTSFQRTVDATLSATSTWWIDSALASRSSSSAALRADLLRQVRRLDGKAFGLQVPFDAVDAEDVSGPQARDDDRATGRAMARKHDIDGCRSEPSRGDISIVGPRPKRRSSSKFGTASAYMLRHKVKAGITGWARSAAGAATRRRLPSSSPVLHRELVTRVTDFRSCGHGRPWAHSALTGGPTRASSSPARPGSSSLTCRKPCSTRVIRSSGSAIC